MIDASDIGAGAVLMQQNSKGMEHLICYFSGKFSLNYPTVENKTLILVLILQHFDVYLKGKCACIVYVSEAI